MLRTHVPANAPVGFGNGKPLYDWIRGHGRYKMGNPSLNAWPVGGWGPDQVVGELDLDDSQLRFQRLPGHPEYMQILINLSGAQWNDIKDLPSVIERTDPNSVIRELDDDR